MEACVSRPPPRAGKRAYLKARDHVRRVRWFALRDFHASTRTRQPSRSSPRPAHTMPANIVSSSSQTHAMHRRVRQQNPASGVSGRHAVSGRGAVALKSAAFTRSRGIARRVVVPHAQARAEPPRAVKQDAAIADLAPKQLPVEQRKVRNPPSRTRRGDADGCDARSILVFGGRGNYDRYMANEIRAARAEGTVAPAGTTRAPVRRVPTTSFRHSRERLESFYLPATTTSRRASPMENSKPPTDFRLISPCHRSCSPRPDPRGAGV